MDALSFDYCLALTGKHKKYWRQIVNSAKQSPVGAQITVENLRKQLPSGFVTAKNADQKLADMLNSFIVAGLLTRNPFNSIDGSLSFLITLIGRQGIEIEGHYSPEEGQKNNG